MSIIILHLSDIHLKSDRLSNKILDRVERIADAIQREATSANACFVVFSGDIAYSGKLEEYNLAQEFISRLKIALLTFHSSLELRVLMIPGNHDCDFSMASGMREFMLSGGSLRNVGAINEEVVREMTGVQDHFFQFFASIEAEFLGNSNVNEGLRRLYYERNFSIGDHKISFHCFNAAWMSQLHEPQGQMIFPMHLVENGEEISNIVISVLHHPDRWLESNNSRPFREFVEQGSDIILTGHEHHADRFTKRTRTGTVNEYIEGAALQDSDDSRVSGFNLIEIDLDSKKHKITDYEFVKNIYKVQDRLEWKNFEHHNLCLRSTAFVNNLDFAKYLIESGTPFSHRSQRPISLPDIFIYPDLDTMPIDRKRNDEIEVIVASNNVLTFAIDHPLLIVVGADQCGKTSMAKTLYRDFQDRSMIPVIVNGNDINSTDEQKLLRLIDKAIAAQYNSSMVTRYEQLSRERRVLIIDDFDHTNIKNRQGHNLIIENARRHFDRVIVFVGDLFQFSELAQLTGEESALNAFRQVEIREFGHQLRYHLISKWVKFDQDFTVPEHVLEHRIQEYSNMVSTLLMRKTVPSYPVIILSMLQMFDLNQEVAADKGEFGYFYEAFIQQKLAQNKHLSIPASVIIAYTANLAYRLFINKTRTISDVELTQFTSEYHQQYSMHVQQSTILDLLENAEVLRQNSDNTFRFKHRYIYYYFVAKYISINLYTEAEGEKLRGQIKEMIKRVYVEDFYNILMFLVYLTYDEKVIAQMLENGKGYYVDHDPCDLDEHVKHINNLQLHLPPLRFIDGDPQSNRDKYEEKRDKVEQLVKSEQNDQAGDLDDQRKIDDVMQINVAFRSLQIMGQVLRNFPGILRGPMKLDLAQESYFLGLRIMKFMLLLIEENAEDFRDFIVAFVQEFEHTSDMEALEKKSNQLLFRFQANVGYGMIKRISQAVGSRHLKETYKEMLTQQNDLSTRLIDTAIKLDHFINFPKDEVEGLHKKIEHNHYALHILRAMVRDRFILFTENSSMRQSICDQIGIQINDPKMIESSSKR